MTDADLARALRRIADTSDHAEIQNRMDALVHELEEYRRACRRKVTTHNHRRRVNAHDIDHIVGDIAVDGSGGELGMYRAVYRDSTPGDR